MCIYIYIYIHTCILNARFSSKGQHGLTKRMDCAGDERLAASESSEPGLGLIARRECGSYIYIYIYIHTMSISLTLSLSLYIYIYTYIYIYVHNVHVYIYVYIYIYI